MADQNLFWTYFRMLYSLCWHHGLECLQLKMLNVSFRFDAAIKYFSEKKEFLKMVHFRWNSVTYFNWFYEALKNIHTKHEMSDISYDP